MAREKPITPYENLTIKQQRFVDYYDGNGTQAAEKAGYSTPRQEAARLLSNADIQAAIRSRELRRREKTIMCRKDRQKFWTRVITGEETTKVAIGKGKNKKVVSIPPSFNERLKASELLGRSEADFTDKVGLGSIGKDGEITEIPIRFVDAPDRKDDE